MASLIDFIDRVRVLLDQPALGAVAVLGTVPDDDEHSILPTALGCTVTSVDGTEDDPEWLYAMRFADRLVARRVGIVMGLAWRPDPPAVRLPWEVADLAVAEHYGCVERDEVGFLRGWWVTPDPKKRGWTFITPYDDDLLLDGDWQTPYRAQRRKVSPVHHDHERRSTDQ